VKARMSAGAGSSISCWAKSNCARSRIASVSDRITVNHFSCFTCDVFRSRLCYTSASAPLRGDQLP
jgi:hypothetical protein